MFQVEIDSGKSSLFRPDLNRRRLMNKAKTKSMRISVVIVITFIICWTPYYFMMIVFMFHEPDEQVPEGRESTRKHFIMVINLF